MSPPSSHPVGSRQIGTRYCRRQLRRAGILLALGALALACSVDAYAGRELKIAKIPEGEIPNLVKVVAPAARCAAISESFGLLAIGHKSSLGPNLPVIGPNISLFRLDPEGKLVEAPPIAITLPKPASLAAHPHYPLSLAFHPTFPLLYVWADIEPPKTEDPAEKVPYNEFDHLLIYSLAEPEPKLLESFCRGTGYGYGALLGSILLNADATRLYVPNVQHESFTKNVFVMGVGWVLIDADGLPLPVQEGVAPSTESLTATPVPKLDPAAAAAARIGKLAAFQQLRAAGKQPLPRMVTTAPSNAFSNLVPSGNGFYQSAPNVVIFGSYPGPVCWDEGNRQSRMSALYLQPWVPYRYALAGHPNLPLFYLSTITSSYLYRFEQAEGYPTLAPQEVTLDWTAIHTAPIVLVRRKQIALGGQGKLLTIDLDEAGRFTSKALQTVIVSPTVEAVVYSEKFDRLYVATEKSG